MIRSLNSGIRRLRYAFGLLSAVFIVALLAQPAVAATSLAEMDRGAVTMVALFGTLLLAIVIEVWRAVITRTAPIPATSRERIGLRNI